MAVQPSVKLEPFTEADIAQLIGWATSPEFLLQWAGPAFSYPLDRVQLEHHLHQATGRNPDRLIYKAVDPGTSETVGHGELGGIDHGNRSATLARILVGPRELRGQGIGKHIVGELLRIAFEELSLHRVALNVFDFNRPAIRCYEKVGFKHEGVLREACRHGNEYWHVCVMSILEHEFRPARAGIVARRAAAPLDVEQ